MTQNISNSSSADRFLHGKREWAARDFKAYSCTAASRRPGTRDDKTQANLAPIWAQRAIWRSRISKSKSDLVTYNSGSWGIRLLHDVLAAVFLVKIKNLWIGGSSAIQTAVIS
jgi:hypothetical protein